MGQTLCNGCYSKLVSPERKKAKETGAKQRALPAKPSAQKQTAKKQKPHKKKKQKAPHPLGKKERRRLERRLPGIDRLLSFFRAASVQVDLVQGGRLLINGYQTRPLAWILPSVAQATAPGVLAKPRATQRAPDNRAPWILAGMATARSS